MARLFCRGDIVALKLLADGKLWIERLDGSHAEATVEPETTVYRSLVILCMRADDRVESLVLPQVATGNEGHRRLRVWLKWRSTGVA